MYVCLFLMGTARTYFWSASASFMPQLVSRREFPQGGELEHGIVPNLGGGGAGGGRGVVRVDGAARCGCMRSMWRRRWSA
jgi:hypothetical protein